MNNASSACSSFTVRVVNSGDRLHPEDPAHVSHAYVPLMSEETQGNVRNRSDLPRDEELYVWTMRKEAVASCLVEDIFHLRANSAKSESSGLALAISHDLLGVDYDFNWLGRVPCRSVKIAGMVVGIKDYESKRIYTSTTSSYCPSVRLDLHV